MAKLPRILSVATATPPHAASQNDVLEVCRKIFSVSRADFKRFEPVYSHSGVLTRYSSFPLEWYAASRGWKERNRAYISSALDILEQAAKNALARAGLHQDALDDIVLVSTTGIATPSLEALLMERLGMKANIRRTPLFGLGCAGGLLGLSRAADFAASRPGSRVLLLSVELCMLNFQPKDPSKKNIIATALFGDGAAAAIVSTDGAGPAIKASAEHRWPNSLDVMGWEVTDSGLSVVFSQSIPAIVRKYMRDIAADFLASQNLSLGQIGSFYSHPGGAKVLDAMEEAFGIGSGAMEDSRAILRRYGNMSAPTVLFILERALKNGFPGPNALCSALGPGFSAALVLLET